MNVHLRSAPVLALTLCALLSSAQIAQIPVFSGSLNEGFESFTTTSTFVTEPNPFSIFGGAAALASSDAAVDHSGNFFLGSDKGYGQASGGSYFYGNNNAGGTPVTIAFSNPIRQFGGYFNVATTASTPGNTLSFAFFDGSGSQIGATQVVTMSTTNIDSFAGFSSTTPIKSVTLTGFYLVADDLRANPAPVPEPSALAALGLGAVALLRRRKRA